MKNILFLVIALLSSASIAHTEGIYGETRDYHNEKEILARIDFELHAIEKLIREGKKRRNAGSRVKFNYPNLSHDLNVIRHGIQQYLKKPNREPRKIKPLRGDYIR